MNVRLISLAAGTLADVGPVECARAAAAAGWPGCGVWFDAETFTDQVAAEVRRVVDGSGIVALDIEPVILHDRSPIGEQIDQGKRVVDAAVAVGARFVLVASRTAMRHDNVTAFAALCDHAADSGVVPAFEFLPIFKVSTLAEALSIVDEAGRPNGGVLVDTLHLFRSGGTVAELADAYAAAPHRFPYLQIADAPATAPTDMAGLYDEAVNGRLLPGEGALPIADVLAAVPDVPLSFEIRSAHLRTEFPDPTDRARIVKSGS
jgi:sugar phosphate isomerase/epimerase